MKKTNLSGDEASGLYPPKVNESSPSQSTSPNAFGGDIVSPSQSLEIARKTARLIRCKMCDYMDEENITIAIHVACEEAGWLEKHRQHEADQIEINQWKECVLAKEREIASLRSQLDARDRIIKAAEEGGDDLRSQLDAKSRSFDALNVGLINQQADTERLDLMDSSHIFADKVLRLHEFGKRSFREAIDAARFAEARKK